MSKKQPTGTDCVLLIADGSSTNNTRACHLRGCGRFPNQPRYFFAATLLARSSAAQNSSSESGSQAAAKRPPPSKECERIMANPSINPSISAMQSSCHSSLWAIGILLSYMGLYFGGFPILRPLMVRRRGVLACAQCIA